MGRNEVGGGGMVWGLAYSYFLDDWYLHWGHFFDFLVRHKFAWRRSVGWFELLVMEFVLIGLEFGRNGVIFFLEFCLDFLPNRSCRTMDEPSKRRMILLNGHWSSCWGVSLSFSWIVCFLCCLRSKKGSGDFELWWAGKLHKGPQILPQKAQDHTWTRKE